MPVPSPERLLRAVARRRDMRAHRGDAVTCPICAGRWTAFKPDWNRPDALCWQCGAHERHRLQWLLLQQRPELLDGHRALLHFAPEHCLGARLRAACARAGASYTTADLDPAGVDLALDLTDLALPDGAFDAVICSHVLEHVEDDARALRELRRVTAPGGWCLLMFPLDVEREATLEDPAVRSPEARLAAYGQVDHVRFYAPDVAQRMERAGFEVEVVRPLEAFPPDVVARAGLFAPDWAFLCR